MAYEFSVGGKDYRSNKMDVREQNRVVRRILPLVAAGIAGMSVMQEDGEKNILMGVKPFAEALGAMSDSDADYIINACLKLVQRKVEGDKGWAPVATHNGDMMFEDIDLASMYQIVFKVSEDNLGGFFGALQSISPGLMSKVAQTSSAFQAEKTSSSAPSSEA